MESKKWYQKTPAVIIALVLFFPVGLYLMWKYTRWNIYIKTLITCVAATLIFANQFDNPEKTSILSSSDTQTTITQETATNKPISSVSPSTKPTEKVNQEKLTNNYSVPTVEIENLEHAEVVKVVDGDTISVRINGHNETIRIIGMNSPETVDPRKSVECFGKSASDMAKNTLTGTTVLLEQDLSQGERDKYNRLLRYVWFDEGSVDFGAFMIENGYAYEYTYNTSYKYQDNYKSLQASAEQGKKGLWADGACLNSSESSKSERSVSSQTTQRINTNSGSDKDCKDFATHNEAQNYFISKGGSATNNVDRLDGGDSDGIVCETLP